MSACDPLIQAERRFKARKSESRQVGFVPLPRAGGALSHAAASIRHLQRHCQIVWQDLVSQHGFASGHQSVKRFVRKLRGAQAPEAHPVIMTEPGREAEVD
jgi:hypothetical protein